MENLAKLYDKIDQTKSTKEKIQYIKDYFLNHPSEDAAWALFFLSGHKIKRLIGSRKLFEWCLEKVDLPEWLISESYAAVGDTAETIALLMNSNESKSTIKQHSLSEWLRDKILPLQGLNADLQKEKIWQYWDELDQQGIYILNKILTGSLRIGVSHLLTIQALSLALNVPKEILSQRLMGSWTPTAEFFKSLGKSHDPTTTHLNPYPFYLASPIDEEHIVDLGDVKEWTAEWKWDGIRAQCINRDGKVAIWSRGNELISDQFPEIIEALKKLNLGTVLDGEILAFSNNKPLSFGELQQRLGRKKVSKAMIESVPVIYMIYDILEDSGQDIRKKSFIERRAIFENWSVDKKILISPRVILKKWEELKEKKNEASTNGTEGLILKYNNSPYGIGRRRGNWWKYKIDPKTIDAVLIYAQPGQGWRANLYTDYTFGVWHEKELVPITKAYSGLSKEEIYQLDKWIRKNTLEKFGPVRKVKAEQVFEIAFEGIQKSSRHKSGVAFRFPRISRWRNDKPPDECDTLEKIKSEFLKE
jgi:DNA ligase 1